MYNPTIVRTSNVTLSVLALALLAGGAACTHNSTSWHDPSKHAVRFTWKTASDWRCSIGEGPGVP
jgi:hypothetical protein